MRISSINNSMNFQARIKISKPAAKKLASGAGLLTTSTGLSLSGIDTVHQANWHLENIVQQGECYDYVKNDAADLLADKMLPSTAISAPVSSLMATNLFKSAYKDIEQKPKELS